MYRKIILLTIFVGITCGQLIDQGPCPNPTPLVNFNRTKFAGKWSTVKQYPNLYESTARCPTINFIANSDGSFTIAQNEISLATNAGTAWNGIGKFDNGTIGQWRWNVPGLPFDVPNLPYVLIDTDYDTYATVHSCASLGTTYFSFLWVMTKRYPLFVPQSSVDMGVGAAAKAGLNTDYLVPAIQLFCSWPTFSDFMTLFG